MKYLSRFFFTVFLILRRILYTSLAFFDEIFLIHKKTIYIFSYHSVASDQWRFSVNPLMIKKQIEYLQKRYAVISLHDVALFLEGKKNLALPAVVLTFDDGYKDILSIKNYLQAQNICPTLFVLSDTKRADWKELGSKRPFLSNTEIRKLAALGWEVGVHSATHANLSKVTVQKLKQEIIDSKKELEKKLQLRLRYFAYPRGKYTARVVDAVERAQYKLGLTMDDGFINGSTNKLLIPRIGIDRTHTFAEFKATVSPSVIALRSVIKKSFLGNFL